MARKIRERFCARKPGLLYIQRKDRVYDTARMPSQKWESLINQGKWIARIWICSALTNILISSLKMQCWKHWHVPSRSGTLMARVELRLQRLSVQCRWKPRKLTWKDFLAEAAKHCKTFYRSFRTSLDLKSHEHYARLTFLEARYPKSFGWSSKRRLCSDSRLDVCGVCFSRLLVKVSVSEGMWGSIKRSL